MSLTDVACRGAKPDSSGKPIKMYDGGGLHLFVSPSGGKLWRMRYRYEGREKLLSFGPYPEVKLADARALRERAKRTLKEGRDPGANAKAAMFAPAGDAFEAVAREWIAAQAEAWTSAHTARIKSRFERDVFPAIGAVNVAELTAPQILAMLRPVEARAPDVAGRIRTSVGAVMRYAVATGRASRDPAADLRGALKPSPRVKHMARIEAGELSGFLWKLSQYDGDPQTRYAIELVMHTFVRTKEIRFGKWSEIDGYIWRIPAGRMKKHRDHIVPLTKQSLAILSKLKGIAGESEWIVPGGRKSTPISENTMLYALYRLGYHGRATIHGFRGLASTVLNESGLWSVDAIEKQLAHEPGDKVRRAYNAAQFMTERRAMMEWWSNYIAQAVLRSQTDLSDLFE
ncbi:integrase arm-type DNA-binding domain-containing protein [Cereibacter sphaeroides]|nr:integrase arm-type DNA-binding domain-containing protein [Cereibacter sphaeroides]